MNNSEIQNIEEEVEIVDTPSEVEVDLEPGESSTATPSNEETPVDDSEEDRDVRRLRRKEENRKRQNKIRAARQRKDEELQELRQLTAQQSRALQQLEQNQHQLNGMAGQYQQEVLEKELTEGKRLMQYYQGEMAKAITAQDGESYVKISAAYEAENEKIFKLKQTQEQLKALVSTHQRDPREAQWAEQTKRYVDDFKSKNDWYGKPQYMEETEIANRIDKEIATEGYSSGTKAYWNEMNRRLKDELNYLFDEDESGYDRPTQLEKKTAPQRNIVGSSVSSGGNSTANGKVRLKFKAMHVETLKSQGIMDEYGKILDKKRAMYYHNFWNKRS